jgi:hypothetical protein
MLPEFVKGRLKPFSLDLPGCNSWQHKTLNMHRGVIHWDATTTPCTVMEIQDKVRTIVRQRLRPSWWRGFGFGAVVSLSDVDDSLKEVANLVDVRNNGKGTWQWIVLHFPSLQTALGVCTWTEGYLAPVYHDLLAALREEGLECESHQREMDTLQKTLITIQRKLSITHQIADVVQKLTR